MHPMWSEIEKYDLFFVVVLPRSINHYMAPLIREKRINQVFD
jgi:hypothetical protein